MSEPGIGVETAHFGRAVPRVPFRSTWSGDSSATSAASRCRNGIASCSAFAAAIKGIVRIRDASPLTSESPPQVPIDPSLPGQIGRPCPDCEEDPEGHELPCLVGDRPKDDRAEKRAEE